MKREFSSGGIVFNKEGRILLISNAAMRNPLKKYWGFPKGHIEEGEGSKEAAIREIKEETGVEAEIVEKLGDSKYVFTFEGEKIFKVVLYFLMRYVSGDLRKQAEEILEVKWATPEETLKLLSFGSDKQFLKQALEIQDGQ
jgi:8-oxo-dGTP diphosphatase